MNFAKALTMVLTGVMAVSPMQYTKGQIVQPTEEVTEEDILMLVDVGNETGVIEESQITGSISSVPGLKLSNINIAYENVTAVATIDKATGNLVELKLNAPCVLGLDAKLLAITMNNAKVGIQVITEYKISY